MELSSQSGDISCKEGGCYICDRLFCEGRAANEQENQKSDGQKEGKMNNSAKLEELFAEFKNRFGYQLMEKNDDCGYLKFERTAEGCNHVLILEDHRWELTRDDFDPDTDIGDWLIFSMLTNDKRGWFGNFVDTQYPLTYTEYKIIESIIQELEQTDEQAD